MLILTEFTSSMASITAFVPLVAGIAVASIPNAIAYGTGSVNIQQMVRTGVVFNALGLVLVSLGGLLVLPHVLV